MNQNQLDNSGLSIRKVDALASLLRRAPVTDAEAIFASEFLTYVRLLAQEQDALRSAQNPVVGPDNAGARAGPDQDV